MTNNTTGIYYGYTTFSRLKQSYNIQGNTYNWPLKIWNAMVDAVVHFHMKYMIAYKIWVYKTYVIAWFLVTISLRFNSVMFVTASSLSEVFLAIVWCHQVISQGSFWVWAWPMREGVSMHRLSLAKPIVRMISVDYYLKQFWPKPIPPYSVTWGPFY